MRFNFNNNFLVKTQNTILSAAFVLGISTALSAILGFVKSRLLASNFGVSTNLSVFYTADKIPNLIYSVVVVGAISTVFIPVFTDLLKKEKKEAFETASSIITLTILIFTAISTIVCFAAEPIMRALSFNKFTDYEITTGANLMRIMLLSQLILIVGSLVTSVLQSFKYFIIPALAPVVYNFGMIVGIVLFSSRFGIYGPAIGVFIGACLHFLIQIPVLSKTDFKYRFIAINSNPNVLKFASLIPPRLISVLLANLVGTLNNSLAILISTPAVVFLKFATQLQTLPVNLFGLSIASASLPTLSDESDKDQLKNFKKTLITSLFQMLYFVVPCSVILLVLRIPIVRIVYGVSNFPWEATVKTAFTLAFFSVSIFSQSANYLLTRAFYALKDTLTPVKISFITITLNVLITLTFVLRMKFGVWSIALAYSITSLLDFVLLMYYLHIKVGGFEIKSLVIPFTKISYSAILMGITLYIPLKLLDQYVFDTTRTIYLILLTGIAGISGMATYLFFTWILKVEEIELFYKLLKKLNLSKVQKVNLVEAEKQI